METKVEIFLNRPNNLYISGQMVYGQLILDNIHTTRVQCVWFTLIGHGKISTTSVEENDFSNSTECIKYYLFGSKHGKSSQLFEGRSVFNFSFKLRNNLHTSLNSDDVSYELKFVIEKPWKLDKVYKVPLYVLNSMEVNDYKTKVFQYKKIKTFGICKQSSIALNCFIPKSFYVENKSVLFCLELLNKNVNVEIVQFDLFKNISYYTIFDKQNLKIVKQKIQTVDYVLNNSNVTHFLECAVIAQDEDAEISNLFKISYYVRVSFKFSIFRKKISTYIPIMTDDVPLFKFEPQLKVVLPEPLNEEMPTRNVTLSTRNLSLSENCIPQNLYNQNITRNWNSMYLDNPPAYEDCI